jgi:hypothetical protein
MIPRIRWVSFAVLALIAIASAGLAAEGEPDYKPGKGGVGGQFGGSYFGLDHMFGGDWFGDYSKGAMPRFSFAGQIRYVSSKHWRWQVSPGFTWNAYKTNTAIPFTDLNFPDEKVKDRMLILLMPATAQIQYVVKRGRWFYHAGAGPGVYRVWVEDHRKVYADPVTFRLHRGPYPGATLEFGAERFLRAITTTSIEFSWVNHLVFAQRDEQFPSGYNSNLMATELRVGVNYYFDPLRQRKQGIEIPGVK